MKSVLEKVLNLSPKRNNSKIRMIMKITGAINLKRLKLLLIIISREIVMMIKKGKIRFLKLIFICINAIFMSSTKS